MVEEDKEHFQGVVSRQRDNLPYDKYPCLIFIVCDFLFHLEF